ncbi:MAG: lamin tail domain-containing protein [Verrucomicrobiae bacterium]|nr:lamin tail domain-containing protein [Verrucomicrobiae bacterium]
MRKFKSLALIVLIITGLMESVYSQVVLNEILAANNGVVFSPNGDNPDYIELYNNSGSTVSLFGYTLTDNTNSPNKFVFPPYAVIPPYGYVVVWCDSDTNNPVDFHATFALSAEEGEEMALYKNGIRVDYIKFGFQVANRSIGRTPSGSSAWKLGYPTPGEQNREVQLGNPMYLKINEWMATNSKGADWIEIYNPRTNGPVDMSYMYLTSTKMDGTSNLASSVIPPLSFIDSNAFFMLICDKDPEKGANHVDFALSSTYGETTSLYLSNRVTLVDRVVFGPQFRDISMGRLPDGATNIVYFPSGRSTPAESNFMPLTNVVVNELLAHTDPPLEDAVEFYNLTSSAIDISGWWLSNNEDEPQKYRIPSNTVIPPNGFIVFYEYQFNVGANAFTFNSARGDEVVLTSADASGNLTGYRLSKSFGATQNGVSLGRYVKSYGGTDLVPMSKLSFTTNPLYEVKPTDPPSYIGIFRLGTGAPNPYPLVGPIIFSEIMYHPPDIGTNDNALDEYIELCNISSSSFPLYSTATNAPMQYTNTWRIRGEIEFDFPQGVVLPPNGKVLVVNFDPVTNQTQLTAFTQKFNVPTNTPIFGPYKGKLSNRAGTIELYKPDPVQLPPHPDAGLVPYIFVEKVRYEDRNGWAASADGNGFSLHRFSYTGYANDVTNWFAGAPTPGSDFLSPAIIVQPQSLTVSPGDTATLSVSATGTALRYQWFFNGALVINATNPVLSISSVGTNHAGLYWVIVTNELAKATSAVAQLTVSTVAKPQFMQPVLQADGSIKLTVKGVSNQIYAIDSSTNLVDWTPIVQMTNTNSVFTIFDVTTNAPRKFYRSRVIQ